MAGVVEEIFRIKSDTAQVLSQIQQLKGVFTELTEEQKKQVTQLAILEQKEKDLIKARNASTNPTTQIRITKELNENIKQLGFLKDAVDKFAKSETVARVEADALSKSVSNAFKQTQVGGAKKQIELLGQQAAGATKSGFNPLNNSLNQLSRELPAFAVSANVGFLAISNNLPIFFEQLEKINKENSTLLKQGKPIESVFKQLGSAVFSFGSLLSIGVTLLTVFGGKIVETIASLFTQKNSLDNNIEALNSYNQAIKEANQFQSDLQKQIDATTLSVLNQSKTLSDAETGALKALEERLDNEKKAFEMRNEQIGKYITDLLINGDKEAKIKTTNSEKVISIENEKNGQIVRINKETGKIVGQYSAFYNKTSFSITEEFAKKRVDQIIKEYKITQNLIKNNYDAKIKDEIEKENERVRNERKKAAKKIKEVIDLSDKIRQLAIDDMKDEQKRERAQAEFDTERAIRDMKLLKATGEQKTALEIALNNDLVNKLEAIDKKYRDKQDDESRAQAKETGEAMNAVLEDNATTEITILERKIKKLEAQNKKANADEIKNLKVQVYEKKKILLDLQESAAISGLKQNEQGQINEAERYQIEVEYANKRKKLEFDLIDDVKKKEKDELKQRKLAYIDYFSQIIKAAIDATNQILAIKIKEVDGRIEQQQRNVDQVKEIADRGNAQILELEQKRLDDLTKKKAKFVKDQQALAAVELIANTAIAVSKAAAQGGVAAGITIAAALIALIAGLASARSIASQAAFYDGGLYDEKGGYTGDGNPTHESKAFRKPYIHHKQEVIISHKPTRKFKDILLDINDGKVDLNEWKNKVSMYDAVFNGKQPFNLTNPYMNHPQVTNIIQFKQMEAKMDEMNRTLGALKLGLNVDEDGFTTFMQKRVERKNLIKNAAKL